MSKRVAVLAVSCGVLLANCSDPQVENQKVISNLIQAGLPADDIMVVDALDVQRRAIAIGARLDAATTQEEKDAAWAELVALPSIPGGYLVVGDGIKESSTPDGDLTMTSNDRNVAGKFWQADSLVSFESTLSESETVAVHVEVNGHPLDLKFDPMSDRITTDGYGYALSAEDRKVLMGLARLFEREEIGAGPGRPTNHKDFLYRSVNLWSEAPVGHPLARMEFPRGSGQSTPSPKGVGDGANPLSPNNVYHDGWGPHYTNHQTSTGPCEPTCVGRCGAGCGSSGYGNYDYWCASHDLCCGAHGGCLDPTQVECGDEYQDAAANFFDPPDYSSCSAYVTGSSAPKGVSQQYITPDFFAPGGPGTNTWSLRSYNASACFAFAYSTSGAPWTWGETQVSCNFTDAYWYDMTPKLWVIRIRTLGTDGKFYYINSGSWVR